MTGQGATVLNQKRVNLYLILGFIFYHEGGEVLKQAAQRRCGCPLPGSVQGQVGWGSEQPDVAKDVPTHGRGDGLDDL